MKKLVLVLFVLSLTTVALAGEGGPKMKIKAECAAQFDGNGEKVASNEISTKKDAAETAQR